MIAEILSKDPTELIAALGLGGAIAAAVNAIVQRRRIGADTTAVITAAARELVDPLRKELATERAEHAAELDLGRRRLEQMREELASAMDEARALRSELAAARSEADALRRENARYRLRVAELEQQVD